MAKSHVSIEFKTADGVTLRGNYYTSPKPNAPVVILTAGLSFLKEHFIDAFAERFQAAGIAALAYDHRNWGSSDGKPRHETNFFQQADDYSDAITFVQSLAPEIDPNRVCVWGAGHAGGVIMPVGAFDTRVKAVVAMVPFISGKADAQNFPSGYLAAALEERAARTVNPSERSRSPKYVPTFEGPVAEKGEFTVTDETAVIGGSAAKDFHDKCFQRSQSSGTPWPNAISLQTLWHMSKWEPTVWLQQVSPKPFLYVVAEYDKFIPVARQKAAFDKIGEPKQWISLNSEHLETYMDSTFEENVVKQVEWLKEWL